MLPDDVLLEILDFYRLTHFEVPFRLSWKRRRWHMLVHVCQRWRCLVFSSPHRQDVQLCCIDGTPVKEIWPPALPIVMRYSSLNNEENLMTALCQSDRIQVLDITTSVSLGKRLVANMQDPLH